MDFMAQLMEKLQIQIRNKTTKKQQLSVKLGVEFGGEELSGGTWQKIAIARGLYKNHKFIVFDEPTAALDPLVEERIIQQIVSHNPSAIKVYITHRMSMTTSANLIIVFDRGKIVEVGTHFELMEKKGLYEQLWRAQAEWYE